jgi:hypothetical protein
VDPGNSREKVAFSGIVDVLSWRRAFEISQDPNFLRAGQRVVVYPKFLDKLDAILASGDIGLDPVQSRWRASRVNIYLSRWPIIIVIIIGFAFTRPKALCGIAWDPTGPAAVVCRADTPRVRAAHLTANLIHLFNAA